ncbi:MAG TPA: hypothetical protein VK524_26945 [Polyangiaceae bacterium]|nr:hypothetical protein [Polyangiaceae bacterium]
MQVRRGKRVLMKIAFVVWAGALFITATSLSAAHFYAQPAPDSKDAALERALDSLRSTNDAKRWLAVHVLYAQCRCSRRILQHLATSPRPGQVREKLLLVGWNEELAPTLRQIAARGFEITRTTPAELRDRFHVEAAPLLLVVEPQGTVRYAGGYTERKQGPNPLDREIITKLIAHRAADPLPPFGCAVSKELQEILDPLALRALRDE